MIILLTLAMVILSACNNAEKTANENQDQERVKRMVEQWIGKNLDLDLTLGYFTTDGDSCRILFPRTDFYILRYIGRDGCTPCRLHLRRYPAILKELSENARTEIGFVCIVNPHDISELNKTLRSENMANLPIWIDINDKLNLANGFPEIENLQTFLVDRHNNVIAVGDPAINSGVMQLYKRMLTNGKINPASLPKTRLSALKAELDLGEVEKGDTTVGTFILYNSGKYDFILEDIISSCDCTTPSIDKVMLAPGDSATLTVTFSENVEVGKLNRFIYVYGNTEEALTLEITATIK